MLSERWWWWWGGGQGRVLIAEPAASVTLRRQGARPSRDGAQDSDPKGHPKRSLPGLGDQYPLCPTRRPC